LVSCYFAQVPMGDLSKDTLLMNPIILCGVCFLGLIFSSGCFERGFADSVAAGREVSILNSPLAS
jgi:hypothetical protein